MLDLCVPLWLSMQMTHSLFRPNNDCRSLLLPLISSGSGETGVIDWTPPKFGMFCENRLFILFPSINCFMHAVVDLKANSMIIFRLDHVYNIPSLREFLCCSLSTIGSLPDRKNAICPIFSRNCLTS